MPVSTSFLSEETIAAYLHEAELSWTESGAQFADEPYPAGLLSGSPRTAAVLIPMLQRDGDWHILFTRRTSTLAEHSGQVAFPGGRANEPDPGAEMTALREASEEIGISPKDVRILGRLNDFLTITNYRVTPVIGRIPWPYPLRPQTDEVERIFTIPLGWLAEAGNHTIQPRQLPAPYAPVNVIYFKPYDGEILWGASARFTLTLLQALHLMV